MANNTKFSTFLSTLLALLFFGGPAFADMDPQKELGVDSLVYPIVSPRVSSKFGKRHHPVLKYTKHHNGLDLAVPKDTPIRTVAEGVVVFADTYAGYGKLVVVRHNKNLTTHYGHCRTIRVSPGEQVTAGQIVGTVGSTGLATGPHLHFEIRRNGKPLDPTRFFPGLTEKAQG